MKAAIEIDLKVELWFCRSDVIVLRLGLSFTRCIARHCQEVRRLESERKRYTKHEEPNEMKNQHSRTRNERTIVPDQVSVMTSLNCSTRLIPQASSFEFMA